MFFKVSPSDTWALLVTSSDTWSLLGFGYWRSWALIDINFASVLERSIGFQLPGIWGNAIFRVSVRF
ncbi:hypothetical protein RIR_jg30476.t1 [Rhizophagus irregularis DAOM 181602=DAOM 197198]|nr:hypothetical protein RIR_jg30476.t1 [Rhizophagus irregularis DAOM 181602=DAOM 197198]